VAQDAWEHSFCADLDPVCNFTIGNANACRVTPGSCPHNHYFDWFDTTSKMTYTAEAAKWAANIVWTPGCGFPPAARLNHPNGC
jgi:hypothetical protein